MPSHQMIQQLPQLGDEWLKAVYSVGGPVQTDTVNLAIRPQMTLVAILLLGTSLFAYSIEIERS